MDIASVVCKIHVGLDEGLCGLTRDVTSKKNDTVLLVSALLRQPRDEMADRCTGQEGSFRLNQELESTMRSRYLKLPVVSGVGSFLDGRVFEIPHEWQISKTVQGLKVVMRFADHSSMILTCPLVVDNNNIRT